MQGKRRGLDMDTYMYLVIFLFALLSQGMDAKLSYVLLNFISVPHRPVSYMHGTRLMRC